MDRWGAGMSGDATLEADAECVVAKLALPRTVLQAVRLAQAAQRLTLWTARIAARSMPVRPITFSVGLAQRFDIRFAPGAYAANFARRLLPDQLELDDTELVVSPFAPPMRQLGSVRQGVPMWGARDQRGSDPPSLEDAIRAVSNVSKPGGTTSRAVSSRSKPTPASGPKEEKTQLPEDLIAIMNAHRARGH